MSSIKAVCDECGNEYVLYENKFRCKDCKKAAEGGNG